MLLLSLFFDPTAGQEDFFSAQFLNQVLHNLAPAVGPAILGLVATVALTPAGIWLARRTGFLAHPRARDIHTCPVPYGGGLVMFLAFALACLVFLRGAPGVPGLLVLGGATVVFFLIDDRWGIPALVKLGLQAGLAVIAVLVYGFRIGFVLLPGLQVHDLGLFILPVTVLWILGMENSANLLDGVDGLAAGVIGITAVVLLVAATSRPDQAYLVGLAAALVGVCAGFLLFNFHPARIFMGDSGAYFLGLALALLSVEVVAKQAVVAAIIVPLLAMGIPIADTAIAIVRRRRNGDPTFQPDTKHIHHRLLDLGLSQRETCVLFYGTSGILGSIGLTVFGHRRVLGVAIVLMIVVLSTALGERLRLSRRRIPVPFGRVVRLLLQGRVVR